MSQYLFFILHKECGKKAIRLKIIRKLKYSICVSVFFLVVPLTGNKNKKYHCTDLYLKCLHLTFFN